MKVGPPLVLKTVITCEDQQVTVNTEVYGQGGERYFPYPRTTGERHGAVVKILAEDGTELASGPGEYG
jgi:hypothetical protein